MNARALCPLVLLLACDGALGGRGRWLTAPTPETHDAYFPIQSGPHAVDCGTCHGTFDTFVEFDCLHGCHDKSETEQGHQGVTGFEYASAACYSCHPRGTVDHDQFFPIGASSHHGGIACATCHIDPQDRTKFSCLEGACHPRGETDSHHAEVSGYAYASPSCYSCHRRGTTEGEGDHAALVKGRLHWVAANQPD
jgi:hypothetical protein